jgi:hypothetical protein
MSEPRLSKVTITLFWLALLGAWVVLLVTKRWGLGLLPESMVYVQAAKHFVSGQGLSVFSSAGTLQPMTAYPPLFPFVLSWGWFLGLDPYTWARFLNASLFGVNIFLAGLLAFTYTRKLYSAVLAACLLLGSVHILETHLVLLSRPLLMAGTLGFFLVLAMFLKNGTRRSFYAAVILAVVAAMTHTIGLLVIISGIVSFYILTPGTRGERVRRAFLFADFALLPSALWFGWKLINEAPSVWRIFHFHWPSLKQIYGSINTVSIWLLPKPMPDLLRWAALGLVIGVILALVRKLKLDRKSFPASSALALVLFLGIFLLVLLIKAFIVVDTGAISQFGLTVVWAILLILLAISWSGLLQQRNLPGRVRQVIVACLVLFVALTLARAVRSGAVFYKRGGGYSSTVWGKSEVVRNIRALDDVPVYTNDQAAFYYLAGRSSVQLPDSDQETLRFPSRAKVSDDFYRARGLAVIFYPSKENLQALDRIRLDTPLKRFMGDCLAAIYGVTRGNLKQGTCEQGNSEKPCGLR